jgi:hypothetical protein
MNNQKLIQKIYAQINKNIFKQKWECLSDGCSQEAINSHLLQRNGILNTITKNGHLIEVKTEDVFKWEKTEFPLAFNKIGLKNSMAHPLFCDQHDTHIFYNIEKAQIDFYVYQSQLLFTFRAVCGEIRKKQRNELLHSKLLNSNQVKNPPS